MPSRQFRAVLKIQSILILVMIMTGCSTTIAKDTKLSLKGPKAELSRKF